MGIVEPGVAAVSREGNDGGDDPIMVMIIIIIMVQRSAGQMGP